MTSETKLQAAHRPVNFDPTAYEYVFADDSQGPVHLQGGDYLLALRRELAQSPASRYHGDQCDHCGAHFRYRVFLRHVPSGHLVCFGETCVDNRVGQYSQLEFRMRMIRTAAANARIREQRLATRAAFIRDNCPDLEATLTADDIANDFVADVARKLYEYGSLSERQIEAVRRSVQRDAEWAARKAAEDAEAKAPAPTGKATIEGEVLSTRWQDSDFGGAMKMLVKATTAEGNYKVWGSVPKALTGVQRGDKVRFTATFEQSADDPSFGFFRRPTKAEAVK